MTRSPRQRTAPASQRDCRALIDRLFDYLDGELPAADCAEVERHLASCGCCGPFADSLRRTIALCRAAAVPDVPPAVQRAVRRRVRELLVQQTSSTVATVTRRRAPRQKR